MVCVLTSQRKLNYGFTINGMIRCCRVSYCINCNAKNIFFLLGILPTILTLFGDPAGLGLLGLFPTPLKKGDKKHAGFFGILVFSLVHFNQFLRESWVFKKKSFECCQSFHLLPAHWCLRQFWNWAKKQCKCNFHRNDALLLNIDNFEPNQIVSYLQRGYMMHFETTCHVSHVMCHVSGVACHFSTIPKP